MKAAPVVYKTKAKAIMKTTDPFIVSPFKNKQRCGTFYTPSRLGANRKPISHDHRTWCPGELELVGICLISHSFLPAALRLPPDLPPTRTVLEGAFAAAP